jgi:hypothetical protein
MENPPHPPPPVIPSPEHPYTGKIVPSALCVILFIAFFCPWLGGGERMRTGLDAHLDLNIPNFLWLLPVFGFFTLYACHQQQRFVPAAVVTGMFPFAVFVYSFSKLGPFLPPAVSFGWWLAIFSGFLLTASALRTTKLGTALVNRTKRVEVIDHFYIPFDHFNMSSKEFYAAVQRELEVRKVPGLQASEISFHEAGFISVKRLYLRLTRGNLVFDVCAAPFGRSYFFSCRFCSVPITMHPAEVFLSLLMLLVGFAALTSRFGLINGLLILGLLVVLVVGSMRSLIDWLNAQFGVELPEVPIFGALVARFSKETYYEYDTKLMYLTVVPGVVRDLVSRFTAEQGIQRMEEFRRIRGSHDLYQPQYHALKPCSPPSKPN